MKWFHDYHLRRAVLVDKLYRQALFNIPHVFCLCNCHHVDETASNHDVNTIYHTKLQDKSSATLFVFMSDIGKNLNETTPLFVSTGVEQSEQY